jgi:hypothetical protein
MSTSLVPIDHPSQLAKLGQAQQMLAECRTLSEVKKIQNYALAYKVYAKAAHLGREIQNSVAEIVLLASRRAGEILSQLEKTPKQNAAKKSTDTVTGDSEYRKTLNETETDERTAERWQKLAAIPQPTVDNYINAAREKKQAITAAGLLKLAPPKERPAPKPTEVRNLREWIKAECPGLDAVIQSHVKYGEESMNFDLEFRDITPDEVKLICKSLRELRSKGKAAA